MKNTLLILFTSLVWNITSQTITITNNSGTNSITCQTPSINFIVSCTGFSTTATINWLSNLFPPITGSNVNLSNPSVYTVSILIGNALTIQTLAVIMNTLVPVTSISSNSINLGAGTTTVSLLAINPASGIIQKVYTPLGDSLESNLSAFIYTINTAGTYTHCVTDIETGCKTCKSFTAFLSLRIGEKIINRNNIKIMYNASSECIIEAKEDMILRLVDFNGKEVRTFQLNEKCAYKVELTAIEAGVYVLISEDALFKQKVIIK